jgi:hypothetical protein
VLRPLLAGPWENIRPLMGICETPAILPDGRLLAGKGVYDDDTGLLLETLDIKPIETSKAAAETALKTLEEIYKEFPFKTDVDKAVAISAALTAIEAPVLDAVPLHAFDAPAAGSGKTLLVQVAAYIATGRKIAAIPETKQDEEMRKRIMSILLSGDQMVMLDNLTAPLESPALCAAITGSVYSDRLLGLNEKPTLPSQTFWTATGFNLRLVGDLIRRSVGCGIDPKCERPDEREFAENLHSIVPARRAELVHACITIMAAYQAAKRPQKLAPYGNFEDWSRLVREPLVWLGLKDPCESRGNLATNDPEREALLGLMTAWWRQYGGEIMTARKALQDALPDLREAIANVIGDWETVSKESQALGHYLRRQVDRICGGMVFHREGNDKHAAAALWRLAQSREGK